ncbi:hypothetical protein M758_9G034100 [Ceratodon purpureus]|uniref:Glutamyl-tRNA(Gln) amidotransferase subunit C, chloroplastic/mitochondrial n=1 Tax=Ceratodon purpureus TaxID=3225 RepID=A0A8T0GQ21_CERPU|nr:hypothetical protein KC19_9G031600 [Ceratodon purpureus]KAG0605130.1 hypothetical protein M758_9G034100 [Ceratodon purpureus]
MAGVVQGSCKMLPSRLRLPSIFRLSRSAATTTCAASKVDPPNIAHLCEKARLTLSPEEVKDFEPQIGRIVDWFAQLQEIDLTDVPPAIRVGEIDPTKTLRPDTPKTFADREAMLASAPDRDGPFLKVPKIMKENQE